MTFHTRGRFQLIEQALDDGLGDGGDAVAVLFQKLRQRGFEIDDFDAGSLVGAEVDPFAPRLADGIAREVVDEWQGHAGHRPAASDGYYKLSDEESQRFMREKDPFGDP